MATRYGYQTLKWLLERGWKEAPPPEESVYGDQHVLHPQTGEEITVYKAVEIHFQKTGEYPEFLE